MEMTLLGWQIKCMAILPLQVGRATCLESTPVPFLPGRNLQGHVKQKPCLATNPGNTSDSNHKSKQHKQHILIIFSFLIQHLQYFTMELLATMAFEIVSFCRSHCSFLRGCPAGYFGYLWICSAFMAKGPSKPSFRE